MSNSPSARADREHNRQKRVKEIRRISRPGTGFKVHEFTPYQYRVNDRLDIFPTNNRWHDIILNRRGVFTGISADNFVVGYFRQLSAEPPLPSDDGKDSMIAMLEGLIAEAYRIIDPRLYGLTAADLAEAKKASDWLDDVIANGVNVNQ